MSAYRLPALYGLHLDRSRTLQFSFNGRKFSGFEGDTLASALLANQVSLVGRSFKLHRPRGIFSAGVEEPSALVDVGTGAARRPNQRATLVELHDGLAATSVNCWPSVGFDVGALNSLVSAVLPVGFYYKTFKWPHWHWFEPTIRRMAGLGRLSGEQDCDRYEEMNVEAEVLVVGAGICGLTAAVAAARSGAKTLLLAAGKKLGGRRALLADPRIPTLIEEAARLQVTVLTRTTAFGIYDHNLVCAREQLPANSAGGVLRERLWKIRARSVISATGFIERPMVFPDNDRPGVMLAGAAESYALGYGVACGRRAVIAVNVDHAYETAARLVGLGMEIAAIVDRRASSMLGIDRQLYPDLPVFHDAAVVKVAGSRAVRGCIIQAAGGERRAVDCDLILSAGGLTPTVHLHSQAGGKLRWDERAAMFVPEGVLRGLVSVGACAGAFNLETALSHAAEAGVALARGLAAPLPPVGGAGRALSSTQVRSVAGKQFIDLQNDVSADDVALAARENYRSVEHLKRYTTTGMGTDQGKTSNVNALVQMAVETQRAPNAVGTTKFRPPFVPVTMGLLAGRRVGSLFRPMKRLPAEVWHRDAGAAFEEYGGWWRAAAYPREGESIDQAALREARNVRANAGIFDGSTLGKIEVFGPDAGKFLDLMCLGTMSTLKPGQARYAIFLKENGVIADDGIVARLSEQRFWVNTTSAAADHAAAGFEEWLQCEFTSLRVLVTPVTSRWANLTVAGPRAWDWLAAAGFDTHLSPAQMPHMTIADTTLDGVSLRVLRASFSGELSYEINVPAAEAGALLERMMALAPRFSAAPYGLEALQILRIEKGYIVIGTDTDGTTFPGDVGFGKGIAQKAANFVGRRSLSLPVATDSERMQLVGVEPLDRRTRPPVGAHIAGADPPTKSEGHITSSVISAAFDRPIALAMLAGGSRRMGEKIRVHHLGKTFAAEVVPATFYDREGARLNG